LPQADEALKNEFRARRAGLQLDAAAARRLLAERRSPIWRVSRRFRMSPDQNWESKPAVGEIGCVKASAAESRHSVMRVNRPVTSQQKMGKVFVAFTVPS